MRSFSPPRPPVPPYLAPVVVVAAEMWCSEARRPGQEAEMVVRVSGPRAPDSSQDGSNVRTDTAPTGNGVAHSEPTVVPDGKLGGPSPQPSTTREEATEAPVLR